MLKEACSKLRAEDFNKLPQDIVDSVMERIDKVYIDLHMQNPNALLTVLRVKSTGATVIDNPEALKKRRFFDRPKSLNADQFDTAENHLPRVFKKVKK